METEFRERISEIDAAEWDELADDDILACHQWLSLAEAGSSEAIGFVYVLVRDRGKLVGAAAAQRHNDLSRAYSLDHLFFGRAAHVARRTGFGVAPALVVGSRFGISEPFLFASGLSDGERQSVAQLLVDGILDEAGRGNATVLVRNATASSPARILERSNFRATPEVATTYLDLRWKTFAAYRAKLRTIHPSTESAIRQQNNRAKRMGVVLERITDPGQVTDEMHALFDSHFQKLNGVALPLNPEFFRSALCVLGDRAVLTVARDTQQLLGVNFGLRQSGCARSMMVGVDPGKGREAAVYFVLMNNAIERAIEWGDRRLYFGKMLYRVKLLRGCSLAHSTLWIRGRSSLQRGILRSFIRLRTRTVEKGIRPYAGMSASNAAAFGHSQ